jgi:hypothetical protein
MPRHIPGMKSITDVGAGMQDRAGSGVDASLGSAGQGSRRDGEVRMTRSCPGPPSALRGIGQGDRQTLRQPPLASGAISADLTAIQDHSHPLVASTNSRIPPGNASQTNIRELFPTVFDSLVQPKRPRPQFTLALCSLALQVPWAVVIDTAVRGN